MQYGYYITLKSTDIVVYVLTLYVVGTYAQLAFAWLLNRKKV
jgi:hypothetical protein